MSVSQAVVAHLPYLRRYARALTGSQIAGDAYVRATLEAALSDSDMLGQISAGRVSLYRAFNKIWSGGGDAKPGRLDDADGALATAEERLAAITPANRQALLLTTIEGAKFRKPVIPGDQLRVEMTVISRRSSVAKMRGEARVNNELVAECTVMCILRDKGAL